LIGLSFTLDVPFFACFRKPTATSTIISYPVPPFTTIRGLLASCLGWVPRDSLFLQGKVVIGIKPTNAIEVNTEFAKVLKGISREKTLFKRTFPSSPMWRQFLVGPKYQIFISGDEEILADLKTTLVDPQRPLYLGQSDDFVMIDEVSQFETDRTATREVDSALEGVYPGCEIVTLPYRYLESKRGSHLEYKTLSIPLKFPYDARKMVPCYRFGENHFAQLL
jgi:CRISPR-associated protein Cas5h